MRDKDKRSTSNEKPKWNEERRTKLDEQEEQKFVDDIPMEDLKIETHDEKRRRKRRTIPKVKESINGKTLRRIQNERP